MDAVRSTILTGTRCSTYCYPVQYNRVSVCLCVCLCAFGRGGVGQLDCICIYACLPYRSGGIPTVQERLKSVEGKEN